MDDNSSMKGNGEEMIKKTEPPDTKPRSDTQPASSCQSTIDLQQEEPVINDVASDNATNPYKATTSLSKKYSLFPPTPPAASISLSPNRSPQPCYDVQTTGVRQLRPASDSSPSSTLTEPRKKSRLRIRVPTPPTLANPSLECTPTRDIIKEAFAYKPSKSSIKSKEKSPPCAKTPAEPSIDEEDPFVVTPNSASKDKTHAFYLSSKDLGNIEDSKSLDTGKLSRTSSKLQVRDRFAESIALRQKKTMCETDSVRYDFSVEAMERDLKGRRFSAQPNTPNSKSFTSRQSEKSMNIDKITPVESRQSSRTSAIPDPLNPFTAQPWFHLNICCLTPHGGQCENCGRACCKYMEAVYRSKDQLITQDERVKVAKAIKKIRQRLRVHEKETRTFLTCTECGKSVCGWCSSLCLDEWCGFVNCIECKPNMWTSCEWHEEEPLHLKGWEKECELPE